MNRKTALAKLFRHARFFLFFPAVFLFSGCTQPGGPAIYSAPDIPAPSVVRGDGELSASWTEEDGAVYELWYGTNDDVSSAVKWDGPVLRRGAAAGTVITERENGTPYYFWLKKTNGEKGVFGREVSCAPEALPEAPPDFAYVPGGVIAGSTAYAITVTVPPGYTDGGKTLLKNGVFVAGRICALNSFFMAKDETTRRLWYDVQSWAKKNKNYFFQNEKSAPAGADADKPVTGINWRDAVVWCNAYSEYSRFDPVYHYKGETLRDSRDANGVACDGTEMDADRNGFRLPAETEREFAARGGDPGKPDWMYTYAGSDCADDVAWYHGNSPFTVHSVREKIQNALGIYDLSGNVQEWGWDWMNYGVPVTADTPWDGFPSGGRFNQKPMAGGGVRANVTMSCVADHWGFITSYADAYVGFRVMRKAE